MAESKLWPCSLTEREGSLELAWIESKQVGYNIGLSRALWIAGLAA